MEKICVFCGEKPQNKNKEHILPQWLIKYTGDPNRTVRFGFDKRTGEPREYSYNAFAFPACQECNGRFADLEDKVKPILLSLLQSEKLTKIDFNILLDWFDKVRVGLWLAFYYLDKDFANISKPRFNIASRIGLHDRMLQMIRLHESDNELSFRGCDMLSFSFTPSCFSMIINNYCFINISSPFLFSRRLGFPNPITGHMMENGLVDYEMQSGGERIMYPLIRNRFRFKGTSVYQPMFRSSKGVSYYKNRYVKDNSLSFDQGVGEVFIELSEKAKIISSAELDSWVPSTSYTRSNLNPGISIETIELQLYIDSLTPSLDQLSVESRSHWMDNLQTSKQYGNEMIKTLEDNARRLVHP